MSRSQNTKGIIYRTYNSGVADKVVNILDEKGRKISAIAKGVKKQNSKKAHSIEIGNQVKVSLLQDYSTPIITEAELISEFSQWKSDLRSITSLQFICEVIDNFSFEENTDEQVYKIFFETLSIIPDKLNLILASFLLKILDATGSLPEINYYVNTGEIIAVGEGYLSDNSIGYVTRDASSYNDQVNPLIYKSQRFIKTNRLKDVLKLNLNEDISRNMFRIHLGWINQVLGKKLKSIDILLKLL